LNACFSYRKTFLQVIGIYSLIIVIIFFSLMTFPEIIFIFSIFFVVAG